MTSRYASGKWAIAPCDVCGFRYKLEQLKSQVVKGVKTNILACPQCYDPDHPQLFLGTYPINDPQALRNPRPDAGQIESRDIQWGWSPVGGGGIYGSTPNALVARGEVGSVTVN
jgi:hypothetical protein